MTITLIKTIEERLYKICIDGRVTMWITREEYSTLTITPSVQEEKKEIITMAKPTTAIEKNALSKGKEEARKLFVEQRISGYSLETKRYVETMKLVAQYAKQVNALADVLGLTAAEQEDFLGAEVIKDLKSLVISKA